MNIAYGKIGKRIKLDQAHGIGNGDFDAKTLLELMAFHLPNYNFWITSSNDLDMLSDSNYFKMFPNQNVFNLFARYSSQPEMNKDASFFDLGLFLAGPYTLAEKDQTLMNTVRRIDGSEIPWIEIVHDPRFSANQNPLLN